MPQSHFEGYNLWILKPTHLNRGRGIHIFRDLDSLQKLIKQYCSGKTVDNFKKKEKPSEPVEPVEPAQESTDDATEQPLPEAASPTKRKQFEANKIKFNTFII
jgi:hypothetical protein